MASSDSPTTKNQAGNGYSDGYSNVERLAGRSQAIAPSAEFAANSVADPELYRQARIDSLGFWSRQSRTILDWHTPFTQVLDWSNPPFAKWFADGQLNVAYNCVDRHVLAGNGDRVAFHWEGEPGDSDTYTYQRLYEQVQKAANMLQALGVEKGDRVAIYLPMIPEAIVSMLAVARIGAIHSVVFGGFSADSLRSRIDDAGAELVITADGTYRGGRQLALKDTVDQALAAPGHGVRTVLVVERTTGDVGWTAGRDRWWHDEIEHVDAVHSAQPMDAEQPLFILYTSGTTGKPKGILHTSGGYLTQAAFTHRNVFDLHPETDVYWCTADIGWITGHSYVVYGPLANGATQVIYEGNPSTPHAGRWWEIVEKYKVSILYTAPTAIRAFMRDGRAIPDTFDLSSLRLLGSVGEPINPEAWIWYRDVIGAGTTPIVDTWWQTETGAIMISAFPGITALKPGAAQKAVPGIDVEVVDEHGHLLGRGEGGLLTIASPWPSMLRGIWGDPDRFRETYWSRFSGRYFAGDGARLDEDGDIWLLGRVDDVMNVAGHRLSTAEIESSLVAHPYVAEAAVVGADHEITGQTVVAFVILVADGSIPEDRGQVSEELRTHVGDQIGKIARPSAVHIVVDLPKTRSGKIMRRLLKDMAEGRVVGDTTTLADSSVVSAIEKSLD